MVTALPTINVGSFVHRSSGKARANTTTAVVELGSSSEDGNKKDNVNDDDNDNKNGNSDTHMSGTDLGGHDPLLSR
jgi:hypothetical protein